MEKNLNTDTLKSAASNVRSQANEAKRELVDRATPAMDYFRENFEAARDTAAPYIKDAEAMVKRHPFYSLVGAVAIGAIVGAVLARPASRRIF